MNPFLLLSLASLLSSSLFVSGGMLFHRRSLNPQQALLDEKEKRQRSSKVDPKVDPEVLRRTQAIEYPQKLKQLTSLVGYIDRGEDTTYLFEPLKKLSPQQVDHFVEQLKKGTESAELIRALGDKCTYGLRDQIENFLKSMQIVREIPKQNLEYISGDMVGSDISSFGREFAMRLGICKKHSPTKLALLRAIMKDPGFAKIRDDDWRKFVASLRGTSDQQVAKYSPSAVIESLQR